MLGFGPLGSLALGELPRLPDTIDAVAPGDVLTLTLTLDVGRATGEGQLPALISIDLGPQRRNAVAPGALLVLDISLFPGRAIGVVSPVVVPIDAAAVGKTIYLTVELIAGQASGDGEIEYDNAFLLAAA
jgi:hypothetical protein